MVKNLEKGDFFFLVVPVNALFGQKFHFQNQLLRFGFRSAVGQQALVESVLKRFTLTSLSLMNSFKKQKRLGLEETDLYLKTGGSSDVQVGSEAVDMTANGILISGHSKYPHDGD